MTSKRAAEAKVFLFLGSVSCVGTAINNLESLSVYNMSEDEASESDTQINRNGAWRTAERTPPPPFTCRCFYWFSSSRYTPVWWCHQPALLVSKFPVTVSHQLTSTGGNLVSGRKEQSRAHCTSGWKFEAAGFKPNTWTWQWCTIWKLNSTWTRMSFK